MKPQSLFLQWECTERGTWTAKGSKGDYAAVRGHHEWRIHYNGEEIYNGLFTLEDCKQAAQRHEDGLHPAQIDSRALAGVTRVEVIDHRIGTDYRGRAFTAQDVPRVVLSFQDDDRTLKVFLGS